MKDYANRNFNYSDVHAQDKVPIHWGFIIAALLAMLVIYSVWHHRQQAAAVSTPSVSAAPAQAQQANANTNAAAAVSSTKTQAAAPANVNTPPVKFDFYQMLTENPSGNAKSASDSANTTGQSASAHTASRQQGSTSSEVKATPAGNAQYYIEVGSYRSKSDALQQKANLILSEVSPKLIKVLGSNGRYRVLIGPYNKQASAIAERSDLKQNGINGSLIKDSDLKK